MSRETVETFNKGDIVTAKKLSGYAKAINRNTKAIAAPRQKDISTGETGSGGGLTDLTFTEDSRTETTVTITDSSGNTHDINQIDQVVLSNSSGDVLTLNFTN